jgi:hypothetical protein
VHEGHSQATGHLIRLGERDVPPLAFRTLLYRYFFFGWLFRHADRGNPLERAAAFRHNQQQARWLPTYMRRWVGAGLLLGLFGAAIEQGFGSAAASALFYVPGALSVPVIAVTLAAWVGLRSWPPP